MKKMIILAMFFVLGIGVFAACNCDQAKTDDTSKDVAITSADNGKTIEAAIGASVVITLAENQTTTVHWQDKPEQAGDATISEVTSEYITDPNPDGRMGVGGKREFHFKVESAGTVKLTFKSAHISDPNDVYDTFEVTLASK